MKMKNKFNIVLGCIWLVVALFLLKLLIDRMNGTAGFFGIKKGKLLSVDNGITISLEDLSSGDINTLYKSYLFSESEIKACDVNIVSASVHFQKYDGHDIAVELYGNWNSQIEPTVKAERGRLSIKAPNLTLKNKINLGSRKVVIKIPESAASKLFDADVSTVSGSIHSTDIAFDKFNADTTSGSVHVNGDVRVLTAGTVSGSIHVSGSCENMKCETVSGSIHVDSDKPLTGKNKADTVSGSVHITVPEESGLSFEWDSVSGSVNNAFYSGKCKKSGSQIIGDGSASLNVETVSGSIHLNKN